METSTKTGLAIVAVGVLVVGGFLFVSNSNPPSDDNTGGEVGCQLTAAGVSVLADHAKTGRRWADLAAAATGGIIIGTACQKAVEMWDSDPLAPVPVTVDAAGGTLNEALTEYDLTQPAPDPAESTGEVDISTMFDCVLAYDVEFMRQACYDGIIVP